MRLYLPAVITVPALSSTFGGLASAKLQGGHTNVHNTGSACGDHEVDRYMLVSISYALHHIPPPTIITTHARPH